MKKLIIILIFISYTVSYAQDVRFGLYWGFGTYRMENLKDFQSEQVNESLHVKKTEQFPGYFNYVATMEYCLDNHVFGFNAGYYTTGGRNTVSDYSGKYSLDMPVNGIRAGTQYGYLYPASKRLSIFGRLSGGVMFTSLKITESLIIYNVDSYTTTYKFKSLGFFFEPSIGLSYVLWKKIALDYSFGYQANLENKFHLQNNKKVYLYNSSDDPVKAGWSGIRLLIGLSFRI